MEKWEQELASILNGLGVEEEQEDWPLDAETILQETGRVLKNVQWIVNRCKFTDETREDIYRTLRFLCEVEPETEQDQMAKASALLHFCRVVLKLSDTVEESSEQS